MNFKFVGHNTGTLYAQGDETECHRILLDMFPSNPKGKRRDHDLTKGSMLPEPIEKVKVMDP